MRVGTGWDLHKLVPARKLYIGGVEIPHTLGALGHSDGDALLHAIIDALLGALALGDIGTHFPPTDERYRDIDSLELLKSVLPLLAGWEIGNIDCTVILDRPFLQPHIKAIRQSIATTCSLTIEQVSVKAKTSEGVYEQVIMAEALVVLKKRNY